MRQHSEASSGGNKRGRKFFGIGRNGIVLLTASILLLAAVACILLNGAQDRDGWDEEANLQAYPDSGPIYRMIDGTPGKFTMQKDADGDGTWEDVSAPGTTNVSAQGAIDALRNHLYGGEYALVFWGDGTKPMNTVNNGSGSVIFSGMLPGERITLYGALTSAASGGTLALSGDAEIASYANIVNTGTGWAIKHDSSKTADILGGTVENTGTGIAISVYTSAKLNISDAAVASENNLAIYNNGTVTISSGTVSSKGATTVSTMGTLTVTGGTVCGKGNVIENFGTVHISGEGTSLYSGSGVVIYNVLPFSKATVIGASVTGSSSNPAIYTGGPLTLSANVRNTGTGPAVEVASGGTADISGGTAESAGKAISNTGGNVNLSGGTVTGAYAYYSNASAGAFVLSGSPEINGTIRSYAGSASAQLAAAASFDPVLDKHTIEIANPSAGMTAIVGGAAFADKFVIINPNFGLRIGGANLVLAVTHTVTVTAYNITDNAPPSAFRNDPLTFVLTSEEGYMLPDSVAATMGGVTLTSGEYAYDSATGVFAMANVTGDVTVVASGVKACTITFDPNNGDGTWTATVPAGTVIDRPDDPVMYGWSCIGWFSNSVLWTFTNAVNDNMTLGARWAENPDERFTVTFDPDNGNPTWSVTVPKNSPAAEPKDVPSRFGWTFIGWSYGGTPWIFTENVTDSMTISAEWEENSDDRWTVTFDPNNEGPEFTVTAIKGYPAERPDNPVLFGWTFLGWYDCEDNMWIFTNAVNDNVTLTAKWTENPDDRWTVTFNPNNGVAKWTATTEKGHAVPSPEDPSRYGYLFLGWHFGETPWNFTDGVTDNITLAAKWEADPENMFIVTFDPNNGNDAWSAYVPKGTPAAEPNGVTQYGWSLGGWSFEGMKWSFADAVDDNVTLAAIWTENPDERYTVTFDPNNGNGTWTVSVIRNAKVGMPSESPVMRGHAFFGWFDGSGVLWEFGNSVTDNITLKAKWSEDGAEDEDDLGAAAMSSLAMLTAFAALLLMLALLPLIRRPRISGTVTQNGKALGNAEIAYTADGTDGTVTANGNGRFAIPVPIGSEVRIVSVNGNSVSGISVTTEKRVTELNVSV